MSLADSAGGTSSDAVILQSGIDWITVTTADPHRGLHLALWASGLLTHQLRLGNIRKPWGMSGFKGHQVGQVQLGHRGDECILRLSSETAATNWRKAYQLSENCSRIDLQVTHRDHRCARSRIRKHYREALRHSAKQKRGPFVTLITGNDGSDTLYLGRRESNIYCRIYAKGVESKDRYLEESVRYEVEIKNRLALLLCRAIAANGSDTDHAIVQVSQLCESRGVVHPFTPDT
jgi:hypothetical protein